MRTSNELYEEKSIRLSNENNDVRTNEKTNEGR